MSEWPQLEQRLVDCARRRQRRRRIRPALVLVPVAAALALVFGIAGGVPDDERAIPPQTGGPLERVYGVFRQAPELPPVSAEQRARIERGCDDPVGLCLRLGTARRVRDDLYLVQGRAPDELCAVTFRDDRYAGADCTRAGGALSSYGVSSGFTIFPDGVTDVRWTLNDGSVVGDTVERNVASHAGEGIVTSVNWSAGGHHHVQQIPADDRGLRCPDLEPPAADPDDAAVAATATNMSAALLEVEEARLRVSAIRRATPDDVAGCGAAVAERSLVADVTLDGRTVVSVLIGFRNGNAVLWSRRS